MAANNEFNYANQNFAARLRRLRRQANLTQQELANEIGVSVRTVINYEQGRCLPRQTQVISRMGDLFGVSVDYLMSIHATPDDMEDFEWDGIRGRAAVDELVAKIAALFAGGHLSEADRDAAMEAITQAYWESRRNERQKEEAMD